MTDRKNEEDRQRSRTSDDILGISHGGGRDQYGGALGGGQSGGGAYPNPHTGHGGGEGGNRVTGERGDADHTGGQSAQGYYGSGQLGDRNYDDRSHNAASTAGSPEHGDATYLDHPGLHGGDVEDKLAFKSRQQGFDEHQGFGGGQQGQPPKGVDHGGQKREPDSEADRRD